MTRSAAPNQRGGRASSFATIKINVFAANDCAKIEWLERFDMRAMTRRAIPRARLVAIGTPRNETRQRNRMAMNSNNIVRA